MPLGFSRLNFFTKPAGGAGEITATGGTTSIETIGGTNYKIHAFTGNGTFEVTAGSGDVDVLLVGGGGSGGGSLDYGAGGGGGGGQTRYESAVSVSTTSYSITVGAGGAGASSSADKGGDTTGFTYTAEGGGCGGGTEQGKNGESTTNSGAGGGGTAWTSTPGTGGTGSFGGGDAVQGNEAGGGGGGDGSAGADATTTTGGNGGNGVDYSSYFGTSYGASGYFGGGGGGGINISTGGGSGTHGGGNGGDQGSGGNATANTGSGGGGGGLNTSGNKNNGGAGGSGIVLVRYETTEVVQYSGLTRPLTVTSGSNFLRNTSTKQFGASSADNLPRSSNGYQYIAFDDTKFNPADTSQDWTWEYWIYPTAANRHSGGWGNDAQADLGGMSIYPYGSNNLIIYSGGAGGGWRWNNGGTANSITFNAWNHVAICQDSGVWNVYTNGTRRTSSTPSGTMNPTGWIMVGSLQNGTGFEDGEGYYDEVRVSDIVRYSGTTYTVPTAEFTNDNNTICLLHQNATPFADDAS